MADDPIPPCPGPDPAPARPHITVAPGATDCHAHILGPLRRHGFVADRSYTPPEALLSDYRRLLAVLGVTRAVLVQPSVYGTDNRAMLAAMAEAGADFRGVAVVDADVAEGELAVLHAAGVRGVRVNILFRGGVGLDALDGLADRIKDLGWHIQLLIDVSDCADFWRVADRLPVDLVFDHMGHLPAAKGVGDPGFQALLALIREGRAWAKLSGPTRLSAGDGPPWRDVVPFARALVAANPDRLVWGTDWPHVATWGAMPNDGDLLDVLADWVPDAVLRQRILVDNPARLYGFG